MSSAGVGMGKAAILKAMLSWHGLRRLLSRNPEGIILDLLGLATEYK